MAQVCKTQKVASRLVRQVRRIFEQNSLIREDFGDLVTGKRAEDEVEFGNNATLIASGVGGTVRGMQGNDAIRPSAVFVDDLVDAETSKSKERMAFIAEWLKTDVIGLGDEGPLKINVYGNRRARLDHFGLMMADPDLAKEWNVTILSAVLERDDDGHITKVLWVGKYTAGVLEAIERKQGKRAFRTEYENKPYETDELTFSREAILKYAFNSDNLVMGWMGKAAVDVASAKTKGADNTVILAGKRPPGTKQTCIYRGWSGHFRQEQTVSYVITLLLNDPAIREVLVETIGVGIGVYEKLQERVRELGLSVTLTPVDNHYRTLRGIPLNKDERIATKQMRVDDGDIRLEAKLNWLIDEVSEHPNGAHDDAPDCLEMLDSGFDRRVKDQTPRYSGMGLMGVNVLK